MVIDEVSVHFAVSVHGRDRAVISGEGRVTFLEEKADVGILETTAGGAIELNIIGQTKERLPKGSQLRLRVLFVVS